MSRTGVPIGARAEEIYKVLHEGTYTLAAGLHIYDGHDHEPDLGKREGLALGHIRKAKRFRNLLLGRGWPVDLVVGGGSFSFPYYAREKGMFGSPGTAIYWDAGYDALLPDMPFKWAVFLLTQVVDSYPQRHLFTTDLGNKAVAPDKPLEQRVFLPSVPDARLVSQNEEHGVFKACFETAPQVGDYLLAVPGHVCPTTIKYPYSLWVDADGNVTGVNQHTARDRQ
jgi:D-serine deaminase-like pyridoxal phosphate-dependent protein